MSKSDQLAYTDTTLDYWELFRELPEAYMLLRADAPVFTILEVNRARERMTSVRREDVIGRPCLEVYPDNTDTFKKTGRSEMKEWLTDVVRTGKPKRLKLFRYDLANEEGIVGPRYWRSTYLPLSLGGGKGITHVLARTVDATMEVQAEKNIATMEGRLEAALVIGKVGSWVWNVGEDMVIGDRNLARLFGMSRAEAAKGLKLERFIASIHSEDRERVEAAIQRTVTNRAPFDEEYRTVTPGGQVRWVLARGKIEERGGEVLFPGVLVDITERRDLQAQVELAHRQDQLNQREAKILQRRNHELETISRTKDEFVALASHQLRTPATAVKQYLGMVLQGYVGEISPLQTDMLERAFESNERQIQIINQILNAARVDTGRLAMTTMPVDICALVRGIGDDMRSMVEQHGHALLVELPEVALSVSADIGYLRMAIENVLHNAAIYTPNGDGKIGLRLEQDGDQICISISDNGVGIRKADIGKLFTKFSRIHNELSVQAGGSGIGLYLTAEIIRLHGGSVSVSSRIGRGTTFAISLPLEHNNSKAERSKSGPAGAAAPAKIRQTRPAL